MQQIPVKDSGWMGGFPYFFKCEKACFGALPVKPSLLLLFLVSLLGVRVLMSTTRHHLKHPHIEDHNAILFLPGQVLFQDSLPGPCITWEAY